MKTFVPWIKRFRSLRTHCVDHVIEIEGGFVDDPSDSGGATCYGITETGGTRRRP